MRNVVLALVLLLAARGHAKPPEVLYVEGTEAEIRAYARTGTTPSGRIRFVAVPSGNHEMYASSCIDGINRDLLREVSPGVWETTQVFDPNTLFCAIQRYDNEKLRRDRASLAEHLTVPGGGDTLHHILDREYATAPRELPPLVLEYIASRGLCRDATAAFHRLRRL